MLCVAKRNNPAQKKETTPDDFFVCSTKETQKETALLPSLFFRGRRKEPFFEVLHLLVFTFRLARLFLRLLNGLIVLRLQRLRVCVFFLLEKCSGSGERKIPAGHHLASLRAGIRRCRWLRHLRVPERDW